MEKLTTGEPEILPADGIETLEHAIGMDPKRHTALTFAMDEIYYSSETKAEVVKKIAALKATDEERVWMGYILAKKIISMAPFPVSYAMRYL